LKTKHPKFKQELKELASEIKRLKAERGPHNNGFVRGLWFKPEEFRYKHIAYCMLHGTPYERIEQSTREDNKIDMSRVEKIMEDHREVIHSDLPEAV